ncbi:alpha-D-ribose 1-methylphosphonate 5-triphosphate synthase subunit PhnH [Roseomonas rosea]|uniref:Alpha-D-ribose 1-methylphosphonate 5-triphosphate synthase subunit PhnH n=1 Tax=Muricoccus roseus TaxID=198092 RepID=A0A1M6ERJ8_9PROT|nr:phosphonate C-P lyase system protein PhnH [Roseomonas rosea]SHI88036.1 alpha-D-ribose 1-methylphosphonate 5-triphosphate synthase subunit PhnH [Roseomonas rosea]
MSGLLPGFADPVLDAQSAFRAVLEAMSRPGRIQRIPRAPSPPRPLCPAAGAVLLTLVDSGTPLFIDAGPDALEWVRFHAGCPVVADPAGAEFVLTAGRPPGLLSLRAGSDEEPQGSATLILQVQGLEEGAGWRLTGPGIEREHRLRVTGPPEDFVAEWRANAARFPRGVDVILCTGEQVAALPRSLRIEEG